MGWNELGEPYEFRIDVLGGGAGFDLWAVMNWDSLMRSVAGICLATNFECGYAAIPPVHEVFQTLSTIAMLRIIEGIDQDSARN
jgi:hypothetical protein